jgi:hypothetical protein
MDVGSKLDMFELPTILKTWNFADTQKDKSLENVRFNYFSWIH